MVTLIRVHDGFMTEHGFAHGTISIGRGDIIHGRMPYEADTFVSRNDAIIIHSVDGLLHLYNNNPNVIRVFNVQNTHIHRVRPRETVALNTHDRVRLCPKDDADGIHYTDFRFVLNLTDDETPPWDTQESLVEEESVPLPLSYEEGQVESALSLP